MTTVAVTGATGHIGANLVRALIEEGHRVRILLHETSGSLRGVDVETVSGDVLDPASLQKALSGAEVVYHLAARISVTGDPDGMVHKINVVGPRNVAQACLRQGVRRLVHFSSIHAFRQEPLDQPLDETRAPARTPRSLAYDRSKAAGEEEVLAAVAQGLDAVIVNPSGVIGPHDYGPSRMGAVFQGLYRRRFPAMVEGGFNWVDVRDVVRSALAAEKRGRRGERYLLAGHWVAVSELARQFGEISGVPAPRVVSPMWLARIGAPFVEAASRATRSTPLFTSESLVALRANRNVRRDKAERELGHAPRPTRETLADLFDWFRGANML
jgi:dihydroflavonol-4-reductase